MWAFPYGSGYSLYLFCCHAELVEAQQKRMPLLSLTQKTVGSEKIKPEKPFKFNFNFQRHPKPLEGPLPTVIPDSIRNPLNQRTKYLLHPNQKLQTAN